MSNLETRWPFTRAQAIAAGITPMMLRGPTVRRLFRGVYVDARTPFHPQINIRGALLAHPTGAFASHQSAARLYDLPVPDTANEHVSVFAQSDRRKRAGLVSHVASKQTVSTLRGIRLSTPLQLFIDLASLLGPVDLVVLGDAMVRRRLTTPEDLVGACAAWDGRFSREARRAAAYVRRRVDSPMESRLRMLILLAGLPEPEVNFEIPDEVGRLLFKVDLSYPDLKLAIEYDGQQHRADLAQWDTDISRGDWFDRNGWRLLPVISKGIYRRPDQTLERVFTALQQCGYPKLPRVVSPEWRLHFPVRP